MTQTKLVDIAYELKNLWEHLTRKELAEYYNVTERTLYNYSKALNLPKKNDKNILKINEKLQTNPVELYVRNKDGYKKQIFPDWGHFSLWTKAQSYPIILGSQTKNTKTIITCNFAENEKPESVKYKKSVNLYK